MRQAPVSPALVFLAVLGGFLLPGVAAAQVTPMAIGNVQVTPDGGGPLYVAPSTGGQASFYVFNNFDTTQEYELTCSKTGTVSSCAVEVETIVLQPYQTLDVVVSYGVGAALGTGTVTLRADGIAWNTGYYNVTVALPTPPVVALVNHSADNWDRSHCLLAGAGEAAWRCGDLVVSHGLPGFATLGRDRSLSLVYTSGQGTPRPVVTARLTPPLVTGGLTGFRVRLKVGGVWRDSARYQPWTSGARQVALDFDATALATGAHAFDLEVRSEYGGASYDGVTTGTLVVVNRSASLYGQGWSVGGVETLVLNQPGGTGTGLLWVGSEGSARLYARQSADTNRWAAPAGAFRDTIVRNPGNGEYTRTLRHGIRVVFDATGRHIATINRVGQRSDFHWTSSRLDSVRVPPSVTPRPTYRLAYDGSGKLDRITDPAGRVLEATVSSGRLIVLTDPDAKATSFSYDTSGRLVRRTNRRGYGTRFAYAKGLRVTEIRVPIGTGADSAITTYAPWDEQGLATAFAGQVAVDTAQVATRVFGPRVGVADDATFKVDRWGAPVRITDALGAVTTLLRGNAAVPALVTRVTYPNGRKVDLAYDGRGNLTQEKVVTTGLPDAQPDLVTQYWYTSPNTKDAPDSVIAPGGVVTRFSYTTDGVLDLVTAPNGHVTDFDYVTSGALLGSLRAIRELNVPVWDSVQRREVNKPALVQRFGFNPQGNVVADTSPKGRVRSYTRDAYQRVSDSYDPAGHHVSYEYDAVNRLRKVREHLDEVPGSGFTTPLLTEYKYGTDLVDTILDPRNVRRTYGYDAGGRLIAEGDEAGASYQFWLDAGGLDTATSTPMGWPNIEHRYDAVGRRTKTVWPSRYGTVKDSVRYTFDAMGQLVRAEAEGRVISRAWYPTGALKRDSSNLVVDYGYDAAGRRSWYRLGLPGAQTRDSIVYRYNSTTGELRTIAARWWSHSTLTDSVQFRWDSLGRRDTLLYSHGAKVLFMYDEDGALRVLCGTHPGAVTAPQATAFNFAVVQTWVDVDGLTRRTDTGNPGITGCGSSNFHLLELNASNTYDARHHLTRQTMGPHDWTYTYDASGNRAGHIYNGEQWAYTYPDSSNRLATRTRSGGGGTWFYEYWGDGARATESPCGPGVACPGWRGYKYDALARTRITEEHGCDQWDPGSGACIGWGSYVATVNCIYDPLQRLIGTCENGGPWLGYDGDNVVRTSPGNSNTFWTFVHGPGTDDPVMGRYTQDATYGLTYFFATDGQGRQYVVGRSDGYVGSDDENYTLRDGKYSGAGQVVTAFGVQRFPSISQPGLAFFRNRFYDQQTGRWTQEDPIGAAGGLNLYNFAGNNPVAFTDPFGLKVQFYDREAEELYGRLRLAATNASKVKDRKVAAAGRELLGILDALEADEEVVTIAVQSSNLISRFLGTNNGFGRRDDGGGGYGVRIDPLYPSNFGSQLRLAHELGHAYSAMIDGLDPDAPASTFPSAQRSLQAENSMRTIWGCASRVTHIGRAPALNPSCP